MGNDQDVKGRIEEIKTRNEEKRHRVEETLRLIALRGEDHTVVQVLLLALKDKNPRIRERAADTLRWITWREGDSVLLEVGVIPQLVASLQDDNRDVRRSAISTLGFLGGRASEVKEAGGIVALVSNLKDQNFKVRQKAAWALGEMALGGEAKAIAEAGGHQVLLHGAKGADKEFLKELEVALRKMVETGIENEILSTSIQSAQDDNSSEERLFAVKMLGIIGSEGAMVALEAMVESELDPDVAETVELLLENSRARRARDKGICPHCNASLSHLEKPTFCPACGKKVN